MEPDEFEVEVVRNCPSDATYYYLLRYNNKNEAIRFPCKHALRVRTPFEHPIDCKPGTWLLVYSSDHLGTHKVQHIGNRPHVEVQLRLPPSVHEGTTEDSKTTQELVDLLTQQSAQRAANDDDADEGLKATRIDAKKREIALGVASKEQKVLLRGAMNKETIEAYMLNRFHRTELHAQVDAMFKVQNLSAAMMERTFVLVEKVQEAVGRVAEIEKAAAQKIASPPPPPDYTPVLSSVVTAIRDIGVSAMQREDKKLPKPDESAPPVKAAIADKASEFGALLAAATTRSTTDPAHAASEAAPAAVVGKTSIEERLAQLEAERDRLKSELEAERTRLHVLAELGAAPARAAAPVRASSASSRGQYPAREPGSLFPRNPSRNDRCPCGSGRAYRRCCLNNRSIATSPKTPSSRWTTRPPMSYASTPPPAEPARPHPTRASTPPPAEPARPHVPDASTPPPAEPARPHPTRASTPPPAEPARPHVPDASTPPPAEPARPHPTRASTPPPAEPARPHAAAARTPSPSEPARTQSAQPAEAPASAALLASGGNAGAPSAQTLTEIEGHALVLPDGAPSQELQELLVNIHAGKLFDDAPIPAPLVAQVKQVEAVLVNPPAMDRETALRLLRDGTTVESLAALLFFNPILRNILLSRRGT
jgi:hypothetical protein